MDRRWLAALDRLGNSVENFDHMRRLLAGSPVRATLGDGLGHVQHRPAPLDLAAALIARPDQGDCLEGLVEFSHLDGNIEVMPAFQVQRAQVPLKFDAILLAAVTRDIKVGGQPDQRPVFQLDQRDNRSTCPGRVSTLISKFFGVIRFSISRFFLTLFIAISTDSPRALKSAKPNRERVRSY